MSFIGIVSDKKCFESIKEKIQEHDCSNKINLIHINNKSIENMKNIKFEVIVINNNLEKLNDYQNSFEKICSNAKYLIINTDINKEYDVLENQNIRVITYGLNQNSTVTVSSIGDSDILIYLQRNIKDKENNVLDIQEKRVKFKNEGKFKTYEVMIIYIVLTIYCQDIIKEI